jgi:hypothetical protein
MSDRQYLAAYLSTLMALVFVILGAMAIAAIVPGVLGKIEVFGLGTVTGGLIGVLRMPSMRPTGVSDATADKLADKIPPVTLEPPLAPVSANTESA